MKIRKPSELRKKRLRVAVTGPAGARKTTLITHLPRSGETWEAPDGSPGKIVYVASDRTSEGLGSISPSEHDRMIVHVPNGNYQLVNGKPVTDWKEEFFEVCFTNWKEVYPDAVAVVWDSFTGSCYKLLLENMKMGFFTDKGPTNSKFKISDPRAKNEKEASVKIGDKGDYRMVQETAMQGLDWLLGMNDDIHVFASFHESLGEGDSDGQGKVFGPSITGLKGPARVPFMFDINLSLGVSDGKDGGKEGQTRIYTQDTKRYQANVKCPNPVKNPIFLDRDPEGIRELWTYFQDLKGLGRNE